VSSAPVFHGAGLGDQPVMPEVAMGLTKTFNDDPIKFLADYIVVVQDDSEGEPTSKVVNFFLREANSKSNKFVFLVKCSLLQKSEEVIPAYWLPWKKGKANVLTLDDKAQFMFTSEMTNCRFSVLTSNMAKPMVAHVEGTGSFAKRDEYEVVAKFPSRKDDTEKRMRRLSVSGIKNPTRDESDIKTPRHRYVGQVGTKSSAFVFGYRKEKEPTWKFYAQIVEGVMAGDGINALKSAKEKVVPLDQAYEIA
jgi:hypothetical protein